MYLSDDRSLLLLYATSVSFEFQSGICCLFVVAVILKVIVTFDCTVKVSLNLFCILVFGCFDVVMIKCGDQI